MISNSVRTQFEDLLSLVVIRIFAKRKKGMMSSSDFDMVESFGAQKAIGIITVGHKRRDLQEMMDEEIRKACALIAASGCGRCRKTGISARMGSRYVICKCANMVNYRGDSVLPNGEQYSNEYFTGDFSKNALGSKDTVENIAAAVMLFMIPKR
jgi:hypothetical protein